MSTKYFLKRIYSPPTQYGSASSYGSVLEPFLQDPTLCLLIPFSKVFLSIQALYSTEFRRDLVVVMFINARLLSHRLLCPRDSPGKNTRVGCHALVQGSQTLHDSLKSDLQWTCLKKKRCITSVGLVFVYLHLCESLNSLISTALGSNHFPSL